MKIRSEPSLFARVAPCSCWRPAAPGPGQGGLQGRQQGLQGRELQEGHRGLRAGDGARPRHGGGHFYLGSSHQALYRPGKDDAENKAQLDAGHRGTTRSRSRSNTGAHREPARRCRLNTLAALTGIYSEPPTQNFEKAIGYAQQLVQDNPNDPKNLYAMANLYEKFDKVDEAEETYKQVAEQNPERRQGLRRAGRLLQQAALGRGGAFDESVEGRRRQVRLPSHPASAAPASTRTTPAGFYKVAIFYWDKAYRDPLLNDKQKDEYADKGLEAVDKALAASSPTTWRPSSTRACCYRVKAQVTTQPAPSAQQYLDQAATAAEAGAWSCEGSRRSRPERPTAVRSAAGGDRDARAAVAAALPPGPRAAQGPPASVPAPNGGVSRASSARPLSSSVAGLVLRVARGLAADAGSDSTPGDPSGFDLGLTASATDAPGSRARDRDDEANGRSGLAALGGIPPPGAARRLTAGAAAGRAAGFLDHLLRDDADALDAGALGHVHGLHDLAVGHLARRRVTKIVLSERVWKMSLQPLVQLLQRATGLLLTVMTAARDPRCASTTWLCVGGRLLGLVGRRRLRQRDVEALLRQRRHHHEDDQQHQHHVDERRDVDVRLRARRASGRVGLVRVDDPAPVLLVLLGALAAWGWPWR